MRPELFRLFDVGAPAYLLALLFGFMLATAMGAFLTRAQGHDPDIFVDLGISMLIWGVVGARLLHVLADGYLMDYVHLCTDPAKVAWLIPKSECLSMRVDGLWDAATNACHPKERDCLRWANFTAGGLTFYGGLILATVRAYYKLCPTTIGFWGAADVASVGIPLGLAMGRLGCLLGGCCFGSVSSLPWGLSFPAWSDASRTHVKQGLLGAVSMPSLHVHPTQIYESLMSLAVAGWCLFVALPRKRFGGHAFVQFAALYAIGRFAIEFLRDDDRGGGLGLSTSQWVSVWLLLFAVVTYAFRSRSSLAAIVASKVEEQP